MSRRRVATILDRPGTGYAICGLGFAGFAWFALWQGTMAPALTWNDSTAYEAIATHSLWSSTFWTSQKPPITSLLWKLTGTPSGFDLAQTLVFICAWGFLAWTVGRQVPQGWRRIVGTLLVLGFATSTPVIPWNRSVLSDSLAVSEVALLFAATLWLGKRFTLPRIAALGVVAALSVGTRYAELATVGLLALLLLGWAAYKRLRHSAATPLILTALVLVGVSAGSLYQESRSGLTATEMRDVYVVRILPFPNEVAWFGRHGMPDTKAIDRAGRLTKRVKGEAKVVPIPTHAVSVWIGEHGYSTYLWWLVTHPSEIVGQPLTRPELAFNFSNGRIDDYGALNRTNSTLTLAFWPAWIWLLPMAALGMYAASSNDETWRDRRIRLMFALGGIGVLQMLIAWLADGQETTRHTLEGYVEVRLGVFLFFILSLASRRRSSTLAQAGDADQPVGSGELSPFEPIQTETPEKVVGLPEVLDFS
jgi:hypothetical protein